MAPAKGLSLELSLQVQAAPPTATVIAPIQPLTVVQVVKLGVVLLAQHNVVPTAPLVAKQHVLAPVPTVAAHFAVVLAIIPVEVLVLMPQRVQAVLLALALPLVIITATKHVLWLVAKVACRAA